MTKNKRIFSLILMSTSVFSLEAFAATSSLKEDIGGYFSSVNSGLRGARVFLEDTVDSKAKKQIDDISDKVAEVAGDKFYDVLFLDKERYGKVSSTNERVKIYMNESRAINTLFENVVGVSIGKFISTLPVGVKQLSGMVKNHLEKSITQMISGLAVKPLVKTTVNMGLVKSYECSKKAASSQIIAFTDYLNDTVKRIFGNAENKFFNLFSAPSANEDSKVAQTSKMIFPFQEVSGEELTAYFNPPVVQKDKSVIEVKDVLNKYLYDIKTFLNTQLSYAIEEGLSQATKETVKQGVDTVIKGTQYVSTAAGVLVTPGLIGISLVADYSRSYVNNQVNKIVDPFVRTAKNKILSSELIPVNHEHAGSGSFKEVEDGFTSLDIETPTFSAWAKEVKAKAQEKVFQNAEKAVETVKQVVGQTQKTFQEITKDLDGKAGIKASAEYIQDQFSPNSVAAVKWDTPSLIINSGNSKFSDYDSIDVDSLTNQNSSLSLSKAGILNKITRWLSW